MCPPAHLLVRRILSEGRETMAHHPVRDGLPQSKIIIRERKVAASVNESGIV